MIRLLPALLALGCAGPAAAPRDSASFNKDFGAVKPTQVGRYRVGLSLVPDPPPLGELFRVEGTVALKDGTPLERAVVVLDARMPAHDHGMETRPRVRVGECARVDSDDTDAPVRCRHPEGRYIADGFKFHMSGDWTVLMSVDGPAGPDSTTFIYRMP